MTQTISEIQRRVKNIRKTKPRNKRGSSSQRIRKGNKGRNRENLRSYQDRDKQVEKLPKLVRSPESSYNQRN